jgi:N-acetylglutamate synthase-like GNAT family acetyltransferase
MIKFLVRQGVELDQSAIEALLASHSMEANVPPHEFLVAEIDGRLVGLVRPEREGQAVYLRPVVVDSNWQGKGIGRLLVREISKGLPAVQVISRGETTGFYGSLGFIPMAWEQVPDRYRQECETCPDRGNCRPLPMSLNRAGNGLELNKDTSKEAPS